MPRWLRQPRHPGRAWYYPFTLASGSDPRHESRVDPTSRRPRTRDARPRCADGGHRGGRSATHVGMAPKPVADRGVPDAPVGGDREARGQRTREGPGAEPHHHVVRAALELTRWDAHAVPADLADTLRHEDVAVGRGLGRTAVHRVAPEMPLEETVVSEVVGARRPRCRHRLEAHERVLNRPEL